LTGILRRSGLTLKMHKPLRELPANACREIVAWRFYFAARRQSQADLFSGKR
jgi:hypothetical protein